MALLVSVLSINTLAQTVVPDNTKSPLGTNFWFFSPYQYTWPFTNFFLTVSPFISTAGGDWQDDGRKLPLDSLGYPTSLVSGQDASTWLFNDRSNIFPVGDWILLYDGAGTISFAFSSWTIKSQTPGRMVISIPAANQGSMLKITATNSANHLRNIRLLPPGFESTYQTQFFHPRFLEQLKPFRCLRFMDWQNTNGSTNDTWANRTKPGAIQGTDKGVCLEYLIRLCNTLNADIYLCMPAKADDDFMLRFVTMARDSLKPNLKAYFEYSNEVWNYAGGQQDYCQQMGEKLGLGTGWGAVMAYWSLRLSVMLKTIDKVYAGQMDRCVRVIATQVGNTGVLDGLLSTNGNAQYADAVAVAPYFNAGTASGSVDAVISAVAANAVKVDTWIQADLAIARSRNLRLIAYESGLDIFNQTEDIQLKARSDPRMKAIYKSYWDKWRSGGGTMMLQYTFCDPYWGLFPSTGATATDAPGYQAACEWITANPVWWDDKRPTVGVQQDGHRTVAPAEKSVPHVGRTGIRTTVPDARVRVVTTQGRTVGVCDAGPVNGPLPAGLYLVNRLGGSGVARTVLLP